MKEIICHTPVKICAFGELDAADRQLVEKAKEASLHAYAPYSRFRVGAALRLADGSMVCGSNQENAAYPSGLCAERVALFYASAHAPQQPVAALAIAAGTQNGFNPQPITPCGACRQVMMEAIARSGQTFRVLLYGTACVYVVEDARTLLPLAFDGEALPEG